MESLDDETLRHYVKAGRIAAQALAFGQRLIKEGAVIRDVLDRVEGFIAKQGGASAFPAQISLNSVAAHSCPTADDETTFSHTDLIKLDVGVHVNGYIGDTAITINLDGNNEERGRLVEASRAARDAAIRLVKARVTPHQLGAAIEREITSRGFQPVRNLSGHGLGRFQIHTTPSIPNFASGEKRPLVAGQVVAIEPFATTGKGTVYSSSGPTVFALKTLKPVRSPAARELLEKIKTYNGLPFTERWLTREFGAKARLGLLELRRAGILYEYPPLPEESKGLVSQSEHTVLVLEDGCRVLTLDDE
jgi:methionyl aminopeptidase